MDTHNILGVGLVLFTFSIQGVRTVGYCVDPLGERPVMALCEQKTSVVPKNSRMYLDSSFGPKVTKINCTCELQFSGSGTIDISYRTDNQTDCEVEFRLGNREWGCKTDSFTPQVQANNVLSYIKKFDDKQNWYACLGIHASFSTMTITCYNYEIYYAPDEVVNGEFSDWTSWTDCSVSCDTGTQTRTRKCDKPAPRNGGQECLATDGSLTLEETVTKSCNMAACQGEPVDGGLTDWSAWSDCSVSCNGGTRERTRSCSDPEPQNGGSPCSESQYDSEPCNIEVCRGVPIDGGFTEWGVWSDCSFTCNGGTRERSRSCTNPEPQNDGQPCSGDTKNIGECNTQACPVHGDWTNWSDWGDCTETCGGNGVTVRTRTCDNPKPEHGGDDCEGSSSDTLPCGQIGCPVDGAWSTWSVWSSCSISCGEDGFRNRSRTCNNPFAQYGGKTCPGDPFEAQNCYGLPCPINGNWNAWSPWSECSISCGKGGFQTRSRLCNDPHPQYGGDACVGNSTEIQICEDIDCPVHGGWGYWGQWSACSQKCGSGFQTRYRLCDNPAPSFRGDDCIGNSSDARTCYGTGCPVNGEWGQWSPWSQCSVTCADGLQSRNRECNSPAPYNNGLDCIGKVNQSAVCTQNPCPIDGNWGPWSPWSQCSSTCGNGSVSKTRLCNSPPPENGGKNCTGLDMDIQTCYIRHCPISGNWGLWSPWSLCAITCGAGFVSRIRECNNPAPSPGGTSCQGESTDDKECVKNPCPVNGMVGPWSPWSTCSTSCGEGERSRSRFCNNPSPSAGGLNCSDSLKETDECNIKRCPDSGTLTTSTTQRSPETEAVSDKKDTEVNLAAILAGLAGGLVFLLLLVLLIVCIVNRRRRKKKDPSVRYFHGADVTVTENELYNYDGETPSHAVNALFVGGIPETPNSPGYIPHFSTDTGDRYAVIPDSNRTKPKVKERPKLDSVTSHDDETCVKNVNGDVRKTNNTNKLVESNDKDDLGQGVENPGYNGDFNGALGTNGFEAKAAASSEASPYDYIDHEKLVKDDEAFENANNGGEYASHPSEAANMDDTDTDRYKKFINSDTDQSPDDGYLKSPKRDQAFVFPDVN